MVIYEKKIFFILLVILNDIETANGEKKVELVRCPCGYACIPVSETILKNGDKLENTWNQTSQGCNGDTLVENRVSLGTYRVVIYWIIKRLRKYIQRILL